MARLNRPLLLLGVFFLVLVMFGARLGLVPYARRLEDLALRLSYIEGTTDMILESQQAHHKMLVALVENC